MLGAGSWGTALAALIARHGHPDRAVGPRCGDDRGDRRSATRTRATCPASPCRKSLRATTDLAAALDGADLVLVVVPSHAFAETLRALAPHRPAHAGVAWATKGFEPGSGRFLHEVAGEVLGADVPLAVVTGPSFAKEVAAGPADRADRAFGRRADFAQQVADVLHGPAFRAYTGDDMLGAELGGAMKNVLAVATGVADGMQLGLNARAGLITRGLNEMLRLNAAIGGKAETLMGLAGLGDLVLTCTGDLSRNRRLGLALGRGQSLDDAVREIGQVVESVQTADEVMRQAERHGIELPISSAVQRRAAWRDHAGRRPAPAAGARTEARIPGRPVRLSAALHRRKKKARPKPGFLLCRATRRIRSWRARPRSSWCASSANIAFADHAPGRVELHLRADACRRTRRRSLSSVCRLTPSAFDVVDVGEAGRSPAFDVAVEAGQAAEAGFDRVAVGFAVEAAEAGTLTSASSARRRRGDEIDAIAEGVVPAGADARPSRSMSTPSSLASCIE